MTIAPGGMRYRLTAGKMFPVSVCNTSQTVRAGSYCNLILSETVSLVIGTNGAGTLHMIDLFTSYKQYGV